MIFSLWITYFLAFENLYRQLSRNKIVESFPNAWTYVKSSIKTIAYKYYYSFKSHPSPRELRHLATLKELSSDNSIVVTKPDKGSGVVILNKSDYIKKMETITTYPLVLLQYKCFLIWNPRLLTK